MPGAASPRAPPDEVQSNPLVVDAYLGGSLDAIHRSNGKPATATAVRHRRPTKGEDAPSPNGTADVHADRNGTEAGAGAKGGRA